MFSLITSRSSIVVFREEVKRGINGTRKGKFEEGEVIKVLVGKREFSHRRQYVDRHFTQ